MLIAARLVHRNDRCGNELLILQRFLDETHHPVVVRAGRGGNDELDGPLRPPAGLAPRRGRAERGQQRGTRRSDS
jgi:hypothetical protein